MRDGVSVSYLRGFFYALTILLGLILTFQELERGNFFGFRIFTIGLTAIFGIELISGWYLRHESRSQMHIKLSKDSNRIYELLNHLIIPSNLYLWTLVFGFFNFQTRVTYLALGITFLLLILLFTNIRAFYINEKDVFHQTAFSFDIAQIFLFFLITNGTINAAYGNITWTPIVIGAVCFMLLFLNIVRSSKIELVTVYISAAFSVALIGIIYIGTYLGIDEPIRVSLLAVCAYYLISALVHHITERDLTKKLIIEYLLILVLAMTFLQGLT